MWRCDNVGDLGKHVNNTCCGFLGVPFLSFLLHSSAHAEPGHVDTWTYLDDLYVVQRVSAQGCAFWGLVHTAPNFGSKIPPKKTIFGA